MRYTTNYNLRKPEENDPVNIEDLNSNADQIDATLKEHEQLLTGHMQASNPHNITPAMIGAETPEGAQAKADAALADAQAYTDAAAHGIGEQISDLKNNVADGIAFKAIAPNANLMNGRVEVEGYWINLSAQYKTNASSKYVKIKVIEGQTISLCRCDTKTLIGTSIGGVLFTKADDTLIENVDIATKINAKTYLGYRYLTFTVPSGAEELRFTSKLSTTWDITNTALVIYAEDFDNYNSSDQSVHSILGKKLCDEKAREDMQTLFVKKYADFTWTAVGDSLTEVNSRTTLHYHDYIANELGFNVVNMGESGSGYMRKHDSNKAFYQRISATPVDSDVVTIFGSGNDLSLPLGTVTDADTTTVCGCINITIDNLYAIIPTVRLGIITPTPWASYPPSSPGNAMDLYSNAIIEICKRRGIPCLDLYHCSNLRPWDATFRTLAYSKDDGNGVHPDETGHKIIYPMIREFVLSLI